MNERPMNNGESNSHAIYGITFTIIAIVALVALILVVVLSKSQADDTSQSTTVGNTAPAIDNVVTSITSSDQQSGHQADEASISMIENSTKTIYVHGSATDNNGCADLQNPMAFSYKLYRSDNASGSNCTADMNDCYSSTWGQTWGCDGAGDLSIDFQGSMNVYFYGDPTDVGSPNSATTWTSWVQASDSSSATGSGTDIWELNSLIALDVSSYVNYGTVGLGADSSEQTITFTNSGNRAVDADQTASGDMVCNGSGSQNIAVGQTHLFLTAGQGWLSGQALTAAATNFDLSLAQRTDDNTSSTRDAFLTLRMPSTGVRGSCQNTVTFTAKADQ